MTQETVNRPTKPEGWNAAMAASAQAEAEQRHPPRHFPEVLPVRLTEAEIAERGRRAAVAMERVEQLEAAKAAAMSDWKWKIDGAEKERDELLRTIARGTEERAVECIETFEWRTGTVTVVRVDTGAKVRERAMSAAERQPSLPRVDTTQTPLAETKAPEAPAPEAPAPEETTLANEADGDFETPPFPHEVDDEELDDGIVDDDELAALGGDDQDDDDVTEDELDNLDDELDMVEADAATAAAKAEPPPKAEGSKPAAKPKKARATRKKKGE